MKLKPCPFCGGKAYILFSKENKQYHIHCDNCRGRVSYLKTKKEATVTWNRRAGEDELVGALKKCEVILATIVRWNKALEEIIGYVPKTGFEAAETVLAEIRAVLERYGEG